MTNLTYSDITPEVEALSKLCVQNNNIDQLFTQSMMLKEDYVM